VLGVQTRRSGRNKLKTNSSKLFRTGTLLRGAPCPGTSESGLTSREGPASKEKEKGSFSGGVKHCGGGGKGTESDKEKQKKR